MPLELWQHILRFADRLKMFASLLRTLIFPAPSLRHDLPDPANNVRPRLLADLQKEVQGEFLAAISLQQMLSMSLAMRRQYLTKLQESSECMLPSYIHALPTGREQGNYLALDVGGSTMRAAIVQLKGRYRAEEAMEIERMQVSPIDKTVRSLPGPLFFDWIAERVEDMLREAGHGSEPTQRPMPLGLTWSFPIEQTSSRSGKIQSMGKGFCGHQETIGQDLGKVLTEACQRRGINVRVDAIINDSSGTLLSRAYTNPATSMGLILGTGTNAAVHLPVSCLGPAKLALRDASWQEQGKRVVINTELSMFGKGILPETQWDELLNRNSPMPDFQPLEYMTTGRYLGEVLRLIVLEAVETTQFFDGVMPESLLEAYSLDTIALARLEEDNSPDLLSSAAYLEKVWGLRRTPPPQEVYFLKNAAACISQRAAAYLAIAVHSLWRLQKELEMGNELKEADSKTSIACNGSVILKYPGFRSRCQDYIARLIAADAAANEMAGTHEVVLEPTDEAAVLGAAVAVALTIPRF
jgi:hexokinase